MIVYYTEGVCATEISFEIEEGIVKSVTFVNGCNGNLKAIASLVEGMPVANVIKRLKGIACDTNQTSCADQLARALESHA